LIWIAARRLLFIHNPKCAGTSMHAALARRYPDAVATWGRRYDVERDEIHDRAHMSVSAALAHLGEGAGALKSFGLVRDPYARFVSAFLHLQRRCPAFRGLSIEEVAYDVLDEERIRLDWKFIHFAPQYRFFYEGNTRLVDHLWRVEELPQKWDDLCSTLDIDVSLSSENRRDLREQVGMNAAVLGRINRLYARDFAFFGYPKRSGTVLAEREREPYPLYADLWPERRDLDITSAQRVP
jgi:hypothetical protein